MKKYLLSVTAVLLLALSSQILRAQSAQETDPDLQYGTELLKPGTQAPDFKLSDINGKTVKLKKFRGKDVVLVFWASWCPDCRRSPAAERNVCSCRSGQSRIHIRFL